MKGLKVKVLGYCIVACLFLGGCGWSRSGQVEVSATPKSNNAEAQGIVMLLSRAISDRQEQDIRVVSVNTQTGDVTTHLKINVDISPFGEYYKAPATQCSHSWKELVSPDLQKFAVTKHFSNGKYHAGWLDENGKFFDAVKELSLSELRDYDAVGFTEDGEFVFADDVSSSEEVNFFSVPLDNFTSSAVKSMSRDDSFFFYQSSAKGRTYYATDVENRSRYLADSYSSGNTRYVTVSLVQHYEGETTTQLLDTKNNNWSGHFSPSGDKVAVLTMPEGEDLATLCTFELSDDGSFSGETTLKEVTDILPKIANQHHGSIFRSYNKDDQRFFATIIDWR